MLIPKLPREPNLSPTRFLYGIWQNLLGNYNGKIPNLPTNDPNVAPTPLLHAIWKQTQNGTGGLPDQTGHAGEFLGTDGTTASWLAIPGGGDMLAATYDPAGVAAQLAGAAGEAVDPLPFAAAIGSLGGNGVADSGKAVLFGTLGEITASQALVIFDPVTEATLYGDALSFRSGAFLDNRLEYAALSAQRTWVLPDASGTLMLGSNNLSDLSNASTSLTNLGGTTVGQNLFTLPNPSAVTIPSIAADNSVSAISPAAFATLIGAALTSGTLAQFAATTSAQLRTLLSDELGTGAALFDGATPTSFTLTNATGLPPAGVTGVAAILGANTFTATQTMTSGIGIVMRPNNGFPTIVSPATDAIAFQIYGQNDLIVSSGAVTIKSTNPLWWSTDLALLRKAAAVIQMGIDAAGVTNQMFTAANRITSDGVGANLTLAAGNGRGGAGGNLLLSSFTTAGAATAGTLTTRWTLDAATGHFLPGADVTYNIGSATLSMLGVYSAAFYDAAGAQVVTTRQAAIPDVGAGAIAQVAAGATDTIDAINLILAMLRTHGLIAP